MADISLTDPRGGKVTVSSAEQAAKWEARGYTREKPARQSKKSDKSDD